MTTWFRCHARTLLIGGLLCLLIVARCSLTAPVMAAEPPMLLLIEQPAVVYGPSGERIAIPAAAEIDMCASDGALLVYELEPMVIRIPAPCRARPLFADGFEWRAGP